MAGFAVVILSSKCSSTLSIDVTDLSHNIILQDLEDRPLDLHFLSFYFLGQFLQHLRLHPRISCDLDRKRSLHIQVQQRLTHDAIFRQAKPLPAKPGQLEHIQGSLFPRKGTIQQSGDPLVLPIARLAGNHADFDEFQKAEVLVRENVFGIAVAGLVIAAELEHVGAVKDGGGFLVDLLAGLEDLEEDGFEAAARFGGFAFRELVCVIFRVSILSLCGQMIGVRSMPSE